MDFLACPHTSRVPPTPYPTRTSIFLLSPVNPSGSPCVDRQALAANDSPPEHQYSYPLPPMAALYSQALAAKERELAEAAAASPRRNRGPRWSSPGKLHIR